MSDPINVNRPLATNENIGKLRPAQQTPPPQISDPSRVATKTSPEKPGQEPGYTFQFERSSILARFTQLLQNTPGLSETLEHIALTSFLQFTEGAAMQDSAMAALAQSMQMSKEEILEALKFQQGSQTKFTGVLFDLLRGLLSQNKDPDFLAVLARFLKAFDGTLSKDETTAQILRNIKEILSSMPASYRPPLEAMLNRLNAEQSPQLLLKNEVLPMLENTGTGTVQEKLAFLETRVLPLLEGAEPPSQTLTNLKEDIFYLLKHADQQSDGAMERRLEILRNEVRSYLDGAPPAAPTDSELMLQNNLTVLKNEIIPYLSKYVSGTNDFSQVRNIIALLIHNIARLNTSTVSELDARFADFVGYCRFNLGLPADRAEALRTLLNQALQGGQNPENRFFSALTRYLSEAANSGGTNVSRDLASALVLDQSVFAPYTHLFLPVDFEGRFLFTELWLVKEQEEDDEVPKEQREPRPVRLFLTFDIQNLGYFDAAVRLLDGKCSIDLSCPPKLPAKDEEVRNNIFRILAENGLSPEEVRLTRTAEPRTVWGVFDMPEDRRGFIHVTV